MNIEPRRPGATFDFGQAITQMFRSPDGGRFAFRLVFSTGLVMGIIYVVAGFLMAGPYLSMLSNMDATDPDAMFSSFGALVPGYLLMLIGFMVVMAMGEGALHRKLLRGEDGGMFPLRLGRDELRIFCISWGVWILSFLAFFFAILIIALLGGLTAVAVPVLGMIIIGLGYFAGFVVWIFIAIRLAPASALSVNQDRWHLLAAKKITKHRFWSLFLAYLVVGVGGYILNYLLTLIGMFAIIGDGSMFLASGGAAGSGNGSDIAASLAAKFSNPLVLILAVIGAMVYTMMTTLWLLSMSGIGTYAVSWWKGDDSVSLFD